MKGFVFKKPSLHSLSSQALGCFGVNQEKIRSDLTIVPDSSVHSRHLSKMGKNVLFVAPTNRLSG